MQTSFSGTTAPESEDLLYKALYKLMVDMSLLKLLER